MSSAPDAATLTRLHRTIEQELAGAPVEFSSPTRSLESYFLETVSRASGQGPTQGAERGRGVADYLRAGVAEDEKLLDALTHAREEAPPPATATTPAAAPKPDAALLDQLAAGTPAAPPPAAAKSAQPAVDEGLLDRLTDRRQP